MHRRLKRNRVRSDLRQEHHLGDARRARFELALRQYSEPLAGRSLDRKAEIVLARANDRGERGDGLVAKQLEREIAPPCPSDRGPIAVGDVDARVLAWPGMHLVKLGAFRGKHSGVDLAARAEPSDAHQPPERLAAPLVEEFRVSYLGVVFVLQDPAVAQRGLTRFEDGAGAVKLCESR